MNINDPLRPESLQEVETKLKSYEERLKKGFENSMHQKELRSQRVREYFSKVPNLSELRKKFDEHHNEIWEKYVLHQQKIIENKKEIEKKKKIQLKKKQEEA